jgi:hypothetical protein
MLKLPDRRSVLACTLVVMAGCVAEPLAAQIQVSVMSSLASPQNLGVSIVWTASALDSSPGPVTYQFQVQPPGSTAFSIVQDFSLASKFTWTPNTVEGVYQIMVTARDFLAGQTSQMTIPFTVNPLATGAIPVVTATNHPLVALFSAPPCPVGSSIQVVFSSIGSTSSNQTSLRPCLAGATMNVYVGGMAANRTYQMHYQVLNGGITTVDPNVLNFHTSGINPAIFPATSIPVPQTSAASIGYPMLLTGYLSVAMCSEQAYPTATDLMGTVLWYYPQTSLLTRPVPGGTFLMITAGYGTGTGSYGNVTGFETLKEVDLAANTLRQTNADRLSEQLQAAGTDPITSFHHDAVRLTNGNTIVFGYVQRIFPAGTQGSPVPIDIIGLMIMVLDPNFQLLWHWNSFDHDGGGTQLDINRPAVLGSQCTNTGNACAQQGCPPAILSSPANDWLHGNSVQFLPDGSLLVSLRNQDWVVKVDYNNGAGTGNILWRLGLGGDFTMQSTLQYPWFSGQHDVAFQNGGEQVLSLFDNGNTRVAMYPGQDSRGQVLNVNQTTMSVSLKLNVDVGSYSSGFGSAQQLQNGNYVFQSGYINQGPNAYEQVTEFTRAGAIAYQFQGQAASYRTWRLLNLYSAPTY